MENGKHSSTVKDHKGTSNALTRCIGSSVAGAGPARPARRHGALEKCPVSGHPGGGSLRHSKQQQTN